MHLSMTFASNLQRSNTKETIQPIFVIILMRMKKHQATSTIIANYQAHVEILEKIILLQENIRTMFTNRRPQVRFLFDCISNIVYFLRFIKQNIGSVAFYFIR